jgi:hypothetical protein
VGKKAAAAPDYTAAAEKQGQSSKENLNTQNFANRPNINTPFGTESWTTNAQIDPATGQKVTGWTQNTTLNPNSQGALDSQLAITRARSDIGKGMLDRVSSEYGPTMDWSKFGQAGGPVQAGQLQTSIGGSPQDYYDKAGKAVYDQFSARNEPIFQRQQDQEETKLRNQGLRPGDAAYDAQVASMAQQQNDARTNASLQATQAAGSEAQRMQGMGVQQGTFANQAGGQQFSQNMQASNQATQQRQQQIGEEMQKRGFSLNEINGLLTGQQVGMPNMPNFSQAGKADTTQYSNAAQQQYGAATDAANASNATIGGIAKLAGGAMAVSDRRLKTNIELVGEYKGHNVYSYDYIWGEPSVGVMADEVPSEFVHTHPSGYKMVDYAALLSQSKVA